MHDFRITFSEKSEATLSTNKLLEVQTLSLDRPIAPGVRMELRDSKRQIYRLSEACEFSLTQGPAGIALVTHGENFRFITQPMEGKCRTSCWIGAAGLESAMFFSKPLEDNSAENFCLMGCLNIMEYDEQNRLYVICSIAEGEKARIEWDPREVGRKRYKSTILPISATDLNYVNDRYLDVSKWSPSRFV